MQTRPEATTYAPNRLLNAVIATPHLKNDAALSRALGMGPPIISRVRHRGIPVGVSLLMRMHEETGLPTKALHALMGDRRAKFRIIEKRRTPKPTVTAAPTL
jgi:hypothetical protein